MALKIHVRRSPAIDLGLQADPEDDLIPFPEVTANPLTPPATLKGRREYFLEPGSKSALSNLSSTLSLAELVAQCEKPPSKDKDAGNKPLDHYKSRLPPWRNQLRNAFLPLIRDETPYLERLQSSLRSTNLDIYFALTANLGTHTFYVMTLPLGFWYNFPRLATDLVFILTVGVYATGVLKDLLCLPRPLSPPLHRISMSGSAALEYGFPSTHSAHAIAVGLLMATLIPEYAYWLHALNILYVFTIVFGRIYCGMHGFLDVVVGSAMGVAIWGFRYTVGKAMDDWAVYESQGDFVPVLTLFCMSMVLVRVHPEPVDDCPCFDDAVACAGTFAGVYLGHWLYFHTHSHSTIPYSFATSGVVGTALRFVIGVVLIAGWRHVMKRALLKFLPPLFRIIENNGLTIPRRFFTPASQYDNVPTLDEDGPIFEARDLPALLSKLRQVRARDDSVGPQSEADVYELNAYEEYQKQKRSNSRPSDEPRDSALSSSADVHVHSPLPSISEQKTTVNDVNSTIVIPRVRYDVEVVTKFTVYTGISFITTYVCGVLFLALGI